MFRFTSIIAGAVALTASIATAGDHNPPPWRGAPLTTVQGWNFVNGGAAGGINPFPDPGTAPLHNPYTWPGAPANGPQIIGMQGASWSPNTPIGIPGLVVLPGGFVDFFIPNNYDPNTIKECWIQIKFWGAVPDVRGLGFHPNGQIMSPSFPPFGEPPPVPVPGPIPGMSEITIRLQFDGNPAWEILRIQNIGPGDMVLYQVVIDTICPTPGTAAAGLLGIGLLASRRRR